MSTIANLALATLTVVAFDADAQNKPKTQRNAPTFTVELITEKREYKVGEQWLGEFKATATAGADRPMTIRAWTRFFAQYDVVPSFHGAIDDANLSDVLATGGQIWRDGVPVVLWNAPSTDVFRETSLTTVQPGKSVSTTFLHHFGSAIKAGRFRQKFWFAIVVERAPETFMLLFARQPTVVEFVTRGDEIDFETSLNQFKKWFEMNKHRLHDDRPVRGTVIEPTN